MPAHELQRTFNAPVDTVKEAAHDALLSLGAEVEDSDDGMTMSGRTGWTVFSFGEIVEVRLEPTGDGTSVTVSSEQRLRFAIADLGRRNRRNVGTVMNSIATRLTATG